jgi:hypothetical protein
MTLFNGEREIKVEKVEVANEDCPMAQWWSGRNTTNTRYKMLKFFLLV